jgi:hypothetical protein
MALTAEERAAAKERAAKAIAERLAKQAAKASPPTVTTKADAPAPAPAAAAVVAPVAAVPEAAAVPAAAAHPRRRRASGPNAVRRSRAWTQRR